ncbi:hypothetical protein FEM48_Zijuj10G0129700 [Ziziphus jujuba var. spinosa]|uniref:Uncharacterized protein n=1 Tax=Ziziphus jujuba var. spinosa TaxID=714518 RepID=A0A978UNI5_ZIZJJ|nr:hypothetical protein FEM48_Zijuj10G0129700 [Ziziphus jujuba var. spinosa]
MATLIGLLQLMYEGMNASPFDTHYTTMVLFFVSLFVYFIAAIAEEESPQPQNPNDTGITSKTKFFSGCFALNMLLLILIPPFGWFTLASCIAYFVKGLGSSAEMVKLVAINARPTILVYLPFTSSSSVEGINWQFPMLADPSFLYKLLFEQATTIGCSVWLEFKNRKEWDLAPVHVLTVAACDAIVVWSLASCRSYGNMFQFDLQSSLQKLPNNIFERSYPLREFDLQKRLHSFFYKAAELCMAGLTAGAVTTGISAGKCPGFGVEECLFQMASKRVTQGIFLRMYILLIGYCWTNLDLSHVFSSIKRDLNFIDHTGDLGWFAMDCTELTILEFCILGWDNLPTLLMYFINVVLSQEGYFHSVICNSPEFKNKTVNCDLRCMIWDSPPGMEPHFFNTSDYDQMDQSRAAFARQFKNDDPIC